MSASWKTLYLCFDVLHATLGGLTRRYDNPEGIHEEVINPEVVCFRPPISEALV